MNPSYNHHCMLVWLGFLEKELKFNKGLNQILNEIFRRSYRKIELTKPARREPAMSSSNGRPIFHEKMKLKLSDKTPEPVNFFYEDFDRQLKATLLMNFGTVIIILRQIPVLTRSTMNVHSKSFSLLSRGLKFYSCVRG